MPSFRRFAASAVVCLLSTLCSAQFIVTDLGSFDLGGTFDVSYGYALNNLNQVVGSSYTPEGNLHAFLWTKPSGLHDLGTLGGPTSTAYGINDAGQVVGQADLSNGLTHAFLWTKSAGLQDIGSIKYSSYAYAINSLGQVVGQTFVSLNAAHAFLWSASTGMQDLGTLGGSGSIAYGINDQGEVVGQSNTPGDANIHAFLWTQATGMQDLGTAESSLPSYAFSINHQGEMVGYSGTTEAFQLSYGVRWVNEGTARLLPFVSGSTQEFPQAINDSDHITGEYYDVNGFPTAFLFSKANGIQDLNSLISANSGWILGIGTAINKRDQITGWGPVVINGNAVNHAYLLTKNQ